MAQTRGLGGPGFALLERARGTIERYAPDLPGSTVLVGVSGGPDSTALLDVLARLADPLSLQLVVAHVDHGVADGSDEIAARVAREAAESGFEVHVVRAGNLAGSNLQARAREFRYAFFDTIAEQTKATLILTGHTLDDRVETTVARLIHGAGTEGLAGLRPRDGDRLRPLIEVRREETRAYCAARGLGFHDDPSNDDPRFDRGAIRSAVLAAIEQRWGEGAVRAMATSAARLAEDAGALSDLADNLYEQLAATTPDGTAFEKETFDRLPRAMQRRLLERAVGRIRDRSGGIDAVLDALDRKDLKTPARFAVANAIEILVGHERIEVLGGLGGDRDLPGTTLAG